MNITEWLLWFLQCIEAAIITSEQNLSGVLRKTDFWNPCQNAIRRT